VEIRVCDGELCGCCDVMCFSVCVIFLTDVTNLCYVNSECVHPLEPMIDSLFIVTNEG